jgi:hypothetical protein
MINLLLFVLAEKNASDRLIDLCVEVGKIQVQLTSHLASHDKWFWFVLVPIGVGIMITILQNFYLHTQIKRSNGGGSDKKL